MLAEAERLGEDQNSRSRSRPVAYVKLTLHDKAVRLVTHLLAVHLISLSKFA